MKRYKVLLLVLLVAGAVFVVWQQHTAPYRHCEGKIFGTYYNITYQHDTDLQKDIIAALNGVDASLSMFNSGSTISKINSGGDLSTDRQIDYLLPRARKVSEATDGAFDVTVAPLVNAWGFGFKNETLPDKAAVDSIREYVGYDKVRIKRGHLEKDDPRVMLDFSAIAKGYGADVVAQVFEANKVRNYMVELGGDLVVKGKNNSGEAWRIGVARPQEPDSGGAAGAQDYQCVLGITDCAMATSGNYRNFYYKDGTRYAHTIDPRTGYPVQHEIVSATIVAPHCYEADAYATASMVMGIERAKEVIAKQHQLDAYLIYIDGKGEQAVWMTAGFDKYIIQ
ncbi:MAG: FAD:protein FMN transferase [Prevotella sp.]|nr:FAD:protein FMN transferase [Prevotella sp.]